MFKHVPTCSQDAYARCPKSLTPFQIPESGISKYKKSECNCRYPPCLTLSTPCLALICINYMVQWWLSTYWQSTNLHGACWLQAMHLRLTICPPSRTGPWVRAAWNISYLGAGGENCARAKSDRTGSPSKPNSVVQICVHIRISLDMCLYILFCVHIWSLPKMEVPLNHPF